MQPTARERPAGRFSDLDGQPPQVDSSAVADAMDRIRDWLHGWLDRIEALAGEVKANDRALERQRLLLQDEIELHRREWEARVEELDHDRRLLAEAWEQLELAQQACTPMAARPADERLRHDPRSEAPPPPAPAPAPSPEPDGVVDRAILRQFEALRRDVRRTAESRDRSAP